MNIYIYYTPIRMMKVICKQNFSLLGEESACKKRRFKLEPCIRTRRKKKKKLEDGFLGFVIIDVTVFT